MHIFYPCYYNEFRCIAADCPDSCCKEWAVDVDADSAAYYRSLPGSLGDRLRTVLADTDSGAVMTIENRRCPMWRQDGLCEIQAQLGHDALCRTCREFPRLRHDYGDFVELGLELSCPEAARLILTYPGYRMLVRACPGGSVPEYAVGIMDILLARRKEVLAFLDDTRYSIPQALAAILLYSHSVQTELDGADPEEFDPETCLTEAKRYAGVGDIATVFRFFQGLEILTDQWKARLECSPVSIDWTPQLRALARYMIGRYWLQAISDYDLVCRVKLMVVACLLVGALGGDPIETAQLFSKEIENDPDNIDAILDGAYTSPALTDVNLLSLLLS